MALEEKEKIKKEELNSKSDTQKNTKKSEKSVPKKPSKKKNPILEQPSTETINQENEILETPQKKEQKQKARKSSQKQGKTGQEKAEANKKTVNNKKTNTKINKEQQSINKETEEKAADLKGQKKEIKEESINSKEYKEEKKSVPVNPGSQNKEESEKQSEDQIKERIKEATKIVEEQSKIEETSNQNGKNSDLSQVTKPVNLGRQIVKIIENVIFTLIALLALAFTVFTITNTDNSAIANGVSILNVDVSGLDKTAATDKVSGYIRESLGNDIILKHNDFETNIGPEQLETKFDVESAVNAAFEVGSGNNIFTNSLKKITLIAHPVDITPDLSINREQLESTLSVISTQLPDAVIQSDYYIDGKNLVVTAGRDGVVINIPVMVNEVTSELNNLSYINNPVEIATISETPEKINIENLYNEIHKDAVDARYDEETHIVYPEENGLDFDITLDEAKAKIAEIPQECAIPLKVLYPNVTTNMIGMEAFPDLLSSFSTKYPASNKGRTTNLKLAADKVNGTVVLPGETFSYNSVVGERTIAAGYKEAAVYQDGEVVQGLGGGICQISTTLYNAALYANLEIVERRNHQFVPSYVGAGRDATVVYGSQDFKFKNNRNYAIKIVCSVEGGVAEFNIYGLGEADDCEVVISSSITSRNANSFTSATYKTLKQNGQVISTETVSRDTYKSH